MKIEDKDVEALFKDIQSDFAPNDLEIIKYRHKESKSHSKKPFHFLKNFKVFKLAGALACVAVFISVIVIHNQSTNINPVLASPVAYVELSNDVQTGFIVTSDNLVKETIPLNEEGIVVSQSDTTNKQDINSVLSNIIKIQAELSSNNYNTNLSVSAQNNNKINVYMLSDEKLNLNYSYSNFEDTSYQLEKNIAKKYSISLPSAIMINNLLLLDPSLSEETLATKSLLDLSTMLNQLISSSISDDNLSENSSESTKNYLNLYNIEQELAQLLDEASTATGADLDAINSKIKSLKAKRETYCADYKSSMNKFKTNYSINKAERFYEKAQKNNNKLKFSADYAQNINKEMIDIEHNMQSVFDEILKINYNLRMDLYTDDEISYYLSMLDIYEQHYDLLDSERVYLLNEYAYSINVTNRVIDNFSSKQNKKAKDYLQGYFELRVSMREKYFKIIEDKILLLDQIKTSDEILKINYDIELNFNKYNSLVDEANSYLEVLK